MKHTGEGFPHIRLFQLTDDLKRIMWFSSTKSIHDSQIDLTRPISIDLGQESDNFKEYPLPSLSHLSFSVVT